MTATADNDNDSQLQHNVDHSYDDEPQQRRRRVTKPAVSVAGMVMNDQRFGSDDDGSGSGDDE